MTHQITRALVRGARVATLRVRCSCGDFTHDAPRLSQPGRRKLDRLINEHLASAMPGSTAAVLDMATRSTIDSPL